MKTKVKRIIVLILASIIALSFTGCRTEEEKTEYDQMTPEEQAIADGIELHTVTIIIPASGEIVQEIDKARYEHQEGHGKRRTLYIDFYDSNENMQTVKVVLGKDLTYYTSLGEDEE